MQAPDGKERVAIVIPVYNEERSIAENLRTIAETLRMMESELAVSFRLICVDDGSRDATASIIRQLCAETAACELICLTRNFGKEAAIEAGLQFAREANAVIVMDSDLQHPPELIPQMLRLWRSGIDVVEAVKRDRGREPWLYRQLSGLFYRLYGSLSGFDLKDRSDFKLLDKKVVRMYLKLKERNRFFRGLVEWMGYPTAKIPFVVPQRTGGNTRWSFFKLFRLSVTALTTFSSAPLQIVTLLGLLTLTVSIVLGIYSMVLKFLGQAMSGFTTIIVMLLFIGSVLMISLGLIGVYLAQIYDELKGRPSFLINERTGFPSPNRSRDARTDEETLQAEREA